MLKLNVSEIETGHPFRSEPIVTFSARVVYVQPEFKELRRRFPKYVDIGYGSSRFYPIRRCKAVFKDGCSREIAFEYVHMRDASTDEVLAEMDRRVLRPALYEELLGFDEKYPAEHQKFWIVALGSEATRYGRCYVATIWRGGGGLDMNLSDSSWGGDDFRFLAVRK